MAACQLLVQDVGCRRAENSIKGPVFPVVFFWGVGFPILTIFLAICSILELEDAISVVFAAFLSSKLSFSMEFAIFFGAICSILELEAAMSTAFAAFVSQNLSCRTVHGTW